MMSLIMVLKTTYDEYRTTTYDPAAKITLGQNKLTTSEGECFFLEEEHQDLPMDYKPLQGRSAGLVSRNAFITTIESHGLDHLIDTNYVVANLDLDKIQRGWLYKILQDTIQAP
jgi:hypothetical protein